MCILIFTLIYKFVWVWPVCPSSGDRGSLAVLVVRRDVVGDDVSVVVVMVSMTLTAAGRRIS